MFFGVPSRVFFVVVPGATGGGVSPRQRMRGAPPRPPGGHGNKGTEWERAEFPVLFEDPMVVSYGAHRQHQGAGDARSMGGVPCFAPSR